MQKKLARALQILKGGSRIYFFARMKKRGFIIRADIYRVSESLRRRLGLL